MAASNWTTLLFGRNGDKTEGEILGFKPGTACSIHKNMLYIYDAKAWVYPCRFSKPTIAIVHSGCIDISGFHIEATRGPQQAIFVKINTVRYPRRKEGESSSGEMRIMAGIGCCGYDDDGDWVGASRNTIIKFLEWLESDDDYEINVDYKKWVGNISSTCSKWC